MGNSLVKIHTGQGGMDKDTSLTASDLNGNSLFSPNDYIDGQNIRPYSDQQSDSFGNTTATGNKLAWFNSSAKGYDKKLLRLYYTIDDTIPLYSLVVEIFDGLTSFGLQTYMGFFTTEANCITNIEADLTSYGSTNLAGGVFTYDSSVSGQIDILYTGGTTLTDWTLKLTYIYNGATSRVQKTACVHEYLPTILQGTPMIPIGSVDINGDVFVISTNLQQNGSGEIGVGKKINGEWVYTRLVQGTKLNLGYFNLEDVCGERDDNHVQLNYTDFHNRPRSFIYYGAYEPDGALNINNPLNFYELDTISEQSSIFKFPPYTKITLSSQTQSGGALVAGNKRYAIQYITATGNTVDISGLSGVVPAFLESLTGSAILLSGSGDGGITGKINVLALTITADPLVFPKFKLICVDYGALAVIAYVVGTFETQQGIMEVSHTGAETVSAFTIGSLSVQTPDILTVLNNNLVSNRAVISNITEREELDFTAFAQSIALTTAILETESEGTVIDTVGVGMTASGYFQPLLLMDSAGYMDNETYRFALRIKWKGRTYTRNYWIGDIMIMPTGDVSLTTGNIAPAVAQLRVRYLVASGMDWSGLSAYLATKGYTLDNIEGFEITRANCIPEVIASGIVTCAYNTESGGINYVIPYLLSAVLQSPYVPPQYSGGNSSYFQNFIAPNLILNGETIAFQTGDQFRYQGISPEIFFSNSDYYNNQLQASPFEQVNGHTASAAYSTMAIENVILLTSTINNPVDNTSNDYTNSNSKVQFTHSVLGSVTYEAHFVTDAMQFASLIPNSPNIARFYWNRLNISTPLLSLPTGLGNENTVRLNPLIGQYVRPIVNKYGDKKKTIYISTGTFFYPHATSVNIFGGDTVIEKTCVKLGILDLQGGDHIAGNPDNIVGGITFFSQNRIHGQLRTDGGTLAHVFPWLLPPASTWSKRVGGWLEQPSQEAIGYNKGYTIRNNEALSLAYSADTVTSGVQPTRIRYSQLKPINSLIDQYSVFLPDDFRDLELTFGAINAQKFFNNQLYTWQNRSFQQQYFDNNGVIHTSIDAAQTALLIGDGSVLSRKGTIISNMGTQHKWSVVIGRTAGGNDVAAWMDAELGKWVHFGQDGTRVVSNDSKIWNWSQENTKLLNNPFTTDRKTDIDWGSPVYAVWDDNYQEFLWSVRMWTKNQWAVQEIDAPYFKNTIVTNGNDKTYYGLPLFFQALQSASSQLTSNVDYWKPVSGSDYIEHYTIAYNEAKNRFTTFYGFVPNIYMRWSNSFLTTSPVKYTSPTSYPFLDRHFVYDHSDGNICAWWEGNVELAEIVGYSDDFLTVQITGIQALLIDFPTKKYVIVIDYLLLTGLYYYDIDRIVDANHIKLKQPIIGTQSINHAYLTTVFSYDASIEYAMNDNPNVQKRPHAAQYHTKEEPSRVDFLLDGQESYLLKHNPAYNSKNFAIIVTATGGGGTILTSTGVQAKAVGYPTRTWYVVVEYAGNIFIQYNIVNFPTANSVTITPALSSSPLNYFLVYRNPEFSDFQYAFQHYRAANHFDTTGKTNNRGDADPLKGYWYRIKVSMEAYLQNTITSIIDLYNEVNRGIFP